MGTHWIVKRGEKETPPLPSEKLGQLAKAGKLRMDDLVRREDQQIWQEARKVKGLFEDGGVVVTKSHSVSSEPKELKPSKQEPTPGGSPALCPPDSLSGHVSRKPRPKSRHKLIRIGLGAVAACLAILHLTAEPIGKLLHWRIANREGLSRLAGMLLLLICLSVLIYVIGSGPGRIARSRHHPQAEAIAICGWLGLLLTGGLLWVVAIVWAHTKPAEFTSSVISEEAKEKTGHH